MSDFWSTILGGALSIMGGFFAYYQQRRANVRSVALAIYGEVHVVDRMTKQNNIDHYYDRLLDNWIENGIINGKELIRAQFERPPVEQFPVYHAILPQLSLLPHALAADIIEYHARIIGLTQLVVRVIISEIPPEQVKVLAISAKAQLDAIRTQRPILLEALKRYDRARFFTPLPRYKSPKTP